MRPPYNSLPNFRPFVFFLAKGMSAKRSIRRTIMNKELLTDASARAIRYLEGIGERSVAPSPDAVEELHAFDEPLPDRETDPAETLRLLDEIGSPGTMAMAGPRFFGFVIGGALPVTVASNWLATAWDQNAGMHAPAPAAAVIERVALGWMLDVLGLPASCGGAFVTGATMANFSALAAARHAVLAHAHDAWVHIDGAFGLWAAASPALAASTAGIAHADSWATDAHKWLNVPYDSGIALVRDAQALRAAMAVSADYLPTEGPFRNPN